MSRSFALFVPVFAISIACGPTGDCDDGFTRGTDGNCYEDAGSTDDGSSDDGGNGDDRVDSSDVEVADTDTPGDACDASRSVDAEFFDFTWSLDDSRSTPCVTIEGRAEGAYVGWEAEIGLAGEVEVESIESGGLNVDVFGDTIFVEGTRVREGGRVAFTVCSLPAICPVGFFAQAE